MLNLDSIQELQNISSKEDVQIDTELIKTMIWILKEIDAIQDKNDRKDGGDI